MRFSPEKGDFSADFSDFSGGGWGGEQYVTERKQKPAKKKLPIAPQNPKTQIQHTDIKR
jgi:hypothetical protein